MHCDLYHVCKQIARLLLECRSRYFGYYSVWWIYICNVYTSFAKAQCLQLADSNAKRMNQSTWVVLSSEKIDGSVDVGYVTDETHNPGWMDAAELNLSHNLMTNPWSEKYGTPERNFVSLFSVESWIQLAWIMAPENFYWTWVTE